MAASIFVAGACSGTTADVETGASGGTADDGSTLPQELPDPTESAPEPGTRPPVDPADLLLTKADLPGWQVSGPQAFPAEPPFESGDCELMNEAWAAHAQPGTRVRATTGGVSVRQAAVEMADGTAAAAVMAAVDMVWESCVELMVDGDQWWAEPVQVPTADGWRAAGLALGGSDQSVWIIGYWQRGSTVVFVDMNGDDVWTYLQPVFESIAGRLGGEPVAVSVPGEATKPIPPSSSVAVPELVPLPPVSAAPEPEIDNNLFPPPGDDWSSHPLASLAPSPAELGEGWRFDNGRRNEAAPSDPGDEIEGCDIAPPPTLDGYELEYSQTADPQRPGLASEMEVIVGLGAAADAQATIDAFRGVAGCEITDAGFDDGLALVAIDVAGADDAVMLKGVSEEFEVEFSFAVARFDGLLIGVSYGFVGDPENGLTSPTPGDIAALIEQMAAAR